MTTNQKGTSVGFRAWIREQQWMLGVLMAALTVGGAALLVVACGSGVRPTGPLPYTPLTYEAAAREAAAQHRLLLVDAMAMSSPPCRTMATTTWPDAELGEWLAGHAITVQVDVDKQRQLAKDLNIEALPTLILFRDGSEVDRSVGVQGPEQLLTWLVRAAAEPASTAAFAGLPKVTPPAIKR